MPVDAELRAHCVSSLAGACRSESVEKFERTVLRSTPQPDPDRLGSPSRRLLGSPTRVGRLGSPARVGSPDRRGVSTPTLRRWANYKEETRLASPKRGGKSAGQRGGSPTSGLAADVTPMKKGLGTPSKPGESPSNRTPRAALNLSLPAESLSKIATMLANDTEATQLEACRTVVEFCRQNRNSASTLGAHGSGAILRRLDELLGVGSSIQLKLEVTSALACLAEADAVSLAIGEQGSLSKLQELSQQNKNRKLQQMANSALRVLAKCMANRVELAELHVAPMLSQLCNEIQKPASTDTARRLSELGQEIAAMCRENASLRVAVANAGAGIALMPSPLSC